MEMRRRLIWSRGVLLCAALALSAASAGAEAPALKDVAPKGLRIGAAINRTQAAGNDEKALAIVGRQFNQVSPENDLKWERIHPEPDRFDFEPADRYVDFGTKHEMFIVGHVLLWHQQTPAWVKAGVGGKPLDRETALARLKAHIDAVVGRYKGRIGGWDVVNEALEDDGTLRKTFWLDAIGEDYVAKAFEFAHAADPGAELYYNDYNLWKPAKRDAAIKLVKGLKAKGLRVDAIGEQGHWGIDDPPLEAIDACLAAIRASGTTPLITELDMDVLPRDPEMWGADLSKKATIKAKTNIYPDGLPSAMQEKLARRYADVFRLFLKHGVGRVTFWGVTDATSWLHNFPIPGRVNYPLLWDREGRPKPAFDAVVDVLRGTKGTTRLRRYDEARVYVTAPGPSPLLLVDRGFSAFEPLEQPDENYPTILIDPDHAFQAIEGFGGAFTDAAADVFAQLPAASQERFLKASFDPVEGNGYTLCRTTIHSCDYAAGMYTYAEVPGDTKLEHFSIEHDRKNRLPFIKRAQAAARGSLRLYASPWSPPGWMKTNGEMKHGGRLLPEYRQTWADYFVKYVEAYAKEGVPIWGLTVQNEALATQVWESCLFTAGEERDFVRDYLGPTLHAHGLGGVKLMIWDHNRGLVYQRAEASYEDPEASKYIWGTAFHWYVGEHHDNVRILHDAFPDKALLFTEGSVRGSWESAFRLARNVIQDLNNWTTGWTVWNLLLDPEGGPRHAGGLMGGTIVNADLKTGELTFNPPHYVFGHFSRFIRPGARRIACTSSSDDFLATAFVNTDGRVAVVLTNLTDHPQIFQLWVEGRAVRYSSPANAVITMVL